MSDSLWPHRWQPTRLLCPCDFPGKSTGVGGHCLLQKEVCIYIYIYTHIHIYIYMKWSEVKSLSRVRLFATPWTVTYQAPPSLGFSRQEYWSGLPFPSPADLPNPGIKPGSPVLQADALPSEPPDLIDTDWPFLTQCWCHYLKSKWSVNLSKPIINEFHSDHLFLLFLSPASLPFFSSSLFFLFTKWFHCLVVTLHWLSLSMYLPSPSTVWGYVIHFLNWFLKLVKASVL